MTRHEAAMRSAFERIQTRPDAPALLQEIHQIQRTHPRPELPLALAYAIGQTSGTFDGAQAYAFLLVQSDLLHERVLICEIDVGSEPHADADIAGNNTALAEIAEPFAAEFWGGLGDADGQLWWSAPITVGGLLPSADRNTLTLAANRRVPLEVGHSQPSRTWARLVEEGVVARWPYGCTSIVLLVDVARCGWWLR